MRRMLLLKTLGIAVLALILLIPVAMIRDLIGERQMRRDEAVGVIAQGWGGRQVVTGPFLVVPYRRLWTEVVHERVEGRVREQRIERVQAGVLRLPLDAVEANATLETSEKSRGIHKARLYAAKVELTARLALPARYGRDDADVRNGTARYEWGAASLVLGVEDPRGLRSIGPLAIDGRTVAFVPGAPGAGIERAVSAPLGVLDATRERGYVLRFAFELAGAESFAIAPLAKETQVAMRASWPHPSFHGSFLPVAHEIRADGFSARWQVSQFAAQAASRLAGCAEEAARCALAGEQLGVSLIEPVGVYRQLDRASKYGFLFIGLLFAAFLLFELLKSLAIHPIQYGLVGLALAMFFLLLVALSEHMAFPLAYAVATLACVGLVTVYVIRVLRGARSGLAFGAGLAALYGALYMLLNAEDHALLAGSLLMFALLAAVMVGSRRVDWYAIGGRRGPQRTEEGDTGCRR